MKLKTESIIDFLKMKLNKNMNEITETDINQIEFILISNKDMKGNNSIFYEEDMLDFKNLKKIIFEDLNIKNSYISILKKLKSVDSIVFSKCKFEGKYNFNGLNLKELIINKSDISNYGFLKDLSNLKELSIVCPISEEEINLDFLKYTKDIEILVLELCIVEKFENLEFAKNLNTISLLMTSINQKDFKYINSLKNLKIIYLNDEYVKFIKTPNLIIKTNKYLELFDVI